ncbi:MAG: GH116 family glycosyl-hydrolase, partial [Defluviitaleaceae bacterium]|nr:GH116 family glycosyl-hydrolase [Defluviitaleaceae bacterium]
MVYENETASQISFPLGGIGTGCIGLAGNGRLVDAEIFNKPNKGSNMKFSHFAVKAEKAGTVVDSRVLNGDAPPPYTGSFRNGIYAAFGSGVDRTALSGLPHFRNCRFTGEFPIAKLDFSDDKFPAKVSLTAFNPFVPSDELNSSIPAAFFTVEFTNDSPEVLEYTAALSAANMYAKGGGLHSFCVDNGKTSVFLSGDGDKNEIGGGDVTIATDAVGARCQLYWYRGNWYDNLAVYWMDFTSPGQIRQREYESAESGRDDVATLAASVTLAPGETGSLRFVLSWSCPVVTNYWNPEDCGCDCDCKPAAWK